MFDLQIGDILLTRNAGGEDQNRSPGWYNHAAITTAAGIVEAQMHVVNGKWSDDKSAPGGVILSESQEFWDRYPIILVRRLPGLGVGEKAAEKAQEFIGTPYWRIPRLFRGLRNLERGVNCVVVVRASVAYAVGGDPGWRRPDHIAVAELPYTVFEKVSEGVP